MSRRDDVLEILGADANNLRSIDVALPRRGVSIIVGVSGSGKSSLLSATLAAEGERRLATFLGIPALPNGPPEVPAFIGPLPPSVHVGQRTFRASVRTTVGTSTGLLSHLRRLYLACSSPWSDALDQPVPPPSAGNYASWLTVHHVGKVTVWAVPVRLEQTDGIREVARLAEAGVQEVVIWGPRRGKKDAQGRRVSTSAFRGLSTNEPHTIEAEIASLSLTNKKVDGQLKEVLERAFEAGSGKVIVELHEATHEDVQSEFGPRLDSTTDWVLANDPRIYAAASRSLLSFNAPGQVQSGACKSCLGTGRATGLREDLLIVHPSRSMHSGAFALWTDKNYKYLNIQHETLEGLRGIQGFDPDVSWSRLPQAARELVLEGTNELVTDRERHTGRKMSAPRPYVGFRRAIVERVAKGGRAVANLQKFVSEGVCPECKGSRWSHQARALRVAGLGIDKLLAQPFAELIETARPNSPLARAAQGRHSGKVQALREQATSFVSVGLSHLSGDRGMLDVSEGESRRTRLAGVFNAREEGLLILLDEPARGLHDIDLSAMAAVLRELGRAHTVILNEHRTGLAAAADHLVELGPGPGSDGGRVVFSGPMSKSRWSSPGPIPRRSLEVKPSMPRLAIRGATLHNLRSVDVSIPLGRLTCLTGVSGSGKSNFARGILVPAMARHLGLTIAKEDFDVRPGCWDSLSGNRAVNALVALDHKPPPPNKRSTVATFTGLAEPMRKAFAASSVARSTGLAATDFGLNSGKGRCPTCLGLGAIEVASDATGCPACGGTGYAQSVLVATVDGLSINDTLGLPVSVLRERATWIGAYGPLLDAMHDLGIGHIALGRRLDSMSGGEIQRLRIAQRLAEHTKGGLLFVLDEPAAGLHHEDVCRLVAALDHILDKGRNTIVLVEHNIPIIRAADWVVEFGPGTGNHGGRVVESGTPAQIARTKCATGRAISGIKPAVALPRPTAERRQKLKSSASSLTMAERVVTSLRRVRGDNVAVHADSNDAVGTDHPVVVLTPEFVAGRRMHEIAGLDVELARVLLDLRGPHTPNFTELITRWQKSAGWLAIQPYMTELQTWGDPIPRSVQKDVALRLRTSHLNWVDLRGRPATGSVPDWRQTRATADRFAWVPGAVDLARQHVQQALALGGGYVELRSTRGDLLFSMGPRMFDSATGLVGPLFPSAIHFSRHHAPGRCPACEGTGVVEKVEDRLVVRSETGKPTEEGFLTPQAHKVLKQTWRSDALPLLKRLESEGLWTGGARLRGLTERERNILLYGCWTRPGYGTFLRTGKDPEEVGSWIRWDGLYRHLLRDLSRTDDTTWRSRVEESRVHTSCPVCSGTGYQSAANLLQAGDESLASFVARRTLSDLDRLLSKLPAPSGRQKRRVARFRLCLEPALRSSPRQRLISAPDIDVALRVAERCVQAFTDMPCLRA